MTATVVHCDQCGARGDTIDSRPRGDGSYRRRRGCPACGHRWSTVEIRIPSRVSAVAVMPAAKVAALKQQLAALSKDLDDVVIEDDKETT